MPASSCHKDSRQNPDRNSNDDRSQRNVQAAQDHRQDAEDVVAGLPCRAQQEFERADLEQGGHAVGKQEDADQCHRQDGHTGAESEHALHNAFF